MVAQTILAFLLIAGFFAVEVLLPRSGAFGDPKSGSPGKGVAALGALYGAAVALSVTLCLLRIGDFHSPTISWTGITLMVLGLGLRTWSLRVLPPFYARTSGSRARAGDILEAPYNVLRYPGYLGSMLVWLALGLALTNWIDLCVIPALVLWEYGRRIRAEERARLAAFGERYVLYQITTWSVVPFFY